MLKNRISLSNGTRSCMAKYKSIYKRVIKEAKRLENDRFLLHATNKPRAVWQIINKELAKPSTKKKL